MKTNILKIGKLLLLGIGVSLVSCEDWLDVRPKSEILTDMHFEEESGFRDQLAGVYTAMTETSMYGRSLSFGLMSVLSQDYDLKSESTYRYAAEYNYEETGSVNKRLTFGAPSPEVMKQVILQCRNYLADDWQDNK